MEGMITKKIFGESGETYYPTIKTLVTSINNTTYPFVSERSFIDTIKTDISQGMQMYWIEILLRAHMSASVSILRFERWMDGVIKSFANNNFFVFSASFKSLIESAAHTYETLRDVPYGLAKNSKMITKSILGHQNTIVISKELEDILIDFLSKKEDIPNSIRSKSTIRYLKKLENGKSGSLVDFYSKLCGITQPAASSIAFFFLPNHENNCILMNGLDEEYIAAFVEGFKSTISDIFQLSLQASFTTLKTLNLFPHELLHTPIIDQIDLPEIDLWNNIVKYFN